MIHSLRTDVSTTKLAYNTVYLTQRNSSPNIDSNLRTKSCLHFTAPQAEHC